AASAQKIGAAGDNLMNTPFISLKHGSEAGPILAAYRRGLAASGAVGREAAILMHCHVAETDSIALERVDRPFARYMQERTPKRTVVEMREMKIAMFGSIDHVVHDVLELVSMGVDHVILFMNFGAMPMPDVAASMRAFATGVLPRVRDGSRPTVLA